MTTFKGPVCAEEGDQVLLVEGKNDCHVVMALLNSRAIERNFGIYECGSYEGILQRLNALIKSSQNPSSIGVVLDANQTGVGPRWQSLKDKLKDRYSYAFPKAVSQEGTVIESADSEPELGVWIMPDNVSPGSLEDFCLKLVPEEEIRVVDRAVKLGEEAHVARFKPVHRSKALIHTYLAWQDEPGNPMGLSITTGRLPSEGAPVDLFVEWLRRLFDF
jgi:hypothetical protein